MALEEAKQIPIIKLSNNNGSYYPLSVPESVYTTHQYEVFHDIGTYKKGEFIDELTTLDTIIANILGAQSDFNAANFIGVTITDPASNSGYPAALTLDDGTSYVSSQYREGDVVIYSNPADETTNVLCVFYHPVNAEHGKWLSISDDILWVGDENNQPPENRKRKVLWLDTTTKTINTYKDSPEMESIKNLIYKLMMSYGKVVKLVENGVKPTDAGGIISGTELNNWRSELINLADPEQPVDIVESNELSNITIFGNDYTGNGSTYRAIFTPNGFNDKQVQWRFSAPYNTNIKKTEIKNSKGDLVGLAEIISESSSILDKPECTLKIYCYNPDSGVESPIIYDDIVDANIELQAIYNLDPYVGDSAVIGTKIIKVGGEKPATDVEPTVKSVCIKMDTAENFAKNKDNLIDGELLFYTDKAKFVVYRCYKNDKGNWIQRFYALQTDESESKGLTEDQLYQLAFKYLQFQDSNGNVYKVYVNNDGKWCLKEVDPIYKVNDVSDGYTGAGSGAKYLSMGTIYCGGNSNTEGKVSHNFVEIYNASPTGQDFNLSGAFLMYTKCEKITGHEGFRWYVLQLDGTIKAGSTFTVRGARSNTDDASFIKVSSYDQEWLDDDGKPIEFATDKGAFYLVNGENLEGKRVLPEYVRTSLENHSFTGFSSKTLEPGYIDGFGFRNVTTITNVPCEKSPLDISPGIVDASNPNVTTADQCIFTKNFTLDPSKQALKAYTSKNTTTLWTYIKFDRQTEKMGNSEQYYWPDLYKKSYTPGCVDDKHHFYDYGRTKFDESKPNAINISFGKQATATVVYDDKVNIDGISLYPINSDTEIINDAASSRHAYNSDGEITEIASSAVYTDKRKYAKYTENSDASRCFNWVSVGNFDEYIEYRKSGEELWTKQYSIIYRDKNDPDSMILSGDNSYVDAPFIQLYKRFTWAAGYDNVWVTTHKRIIRGLSSGTYEYRIGRDNDDSYTTPIRTFVVKNDSQVTDFKFVQITDQQGFNWAEYQTWKRSCYMIDKQRKDDPSNEFDFTVNTGDISQSGNRVSEFLDYFQGREMISDVPEMFTIGNNDLCGRNPTRFGTGDDFDSKYNHINIRKYFTFELDPRNVDDNGDSNYFIPQIDLPDDISGTTKKPFYNIPIESVYSYNYGDYHFISLNSEYTATSVTVYNKVQYDSNTAKEAATNILVKSINARIEKWLKKDLLLWKPDSYHPCQDIKYMASKKYYIKKDEYGNNISNIRLMVPNEDYRVSNDIDAPSEHSDEVGIVYFIKDGVRTQDSVSSSEILEHEPRHCSKCLVYMHEMPFTIVTDPFIINEKDARKGSKLNTHNNMGSYRYSRLFSKYGIRMVFCGHKHTFCITRPVTDAPQDYHENGIIYPDFPDNLGTSITASLSRSPLIQVKSIGSFVSIDEPGTGANAAQDIAAANGDDMVIMELLQQVTYNSVVHDPGYYVNIRKNEWIKVEQTESNGFMYYSAIFSNEKGELIARFNIINKDDKYTYPVYIMSQATGFKLVSNKELMTCAKNVIPWMQYCCNEVNDSTVEEGWKPGRDQLDPMYIVYSMDSDSNSANIKLTSVRNIMTVTQKDKVYSQTCTLNSQNATLENTVLREQTLENI